MLVQKNKSYGNAVLEPLRIFSHTPALDGIRKRIDEKLSRIKNGDDEEDSRMDLIGHLVLEQLAMRK